METKWRKKTRSPPLNLCFFLRRNRITRRCATGSRAPQMRLKRKTKTNSIKRPIRRYTVFVPSGFKSFGFCSLPCPSPVRLSADQRTGTYWKLSLRGVYYADNATNEFRGRFHRLFRATRPAGPRAIDRRRVEERIGGIRNDYCNTTRPLFFSHVCFCRLPLYGSSTHTKHYKPVHPCRTNRSSLTNFYLSATRQNRIKMTSGSSKFCSILTDVSTGRKGVYTVIVCSSREIDTGEHRNFRAQTVYTPIRKFGFSL